MIEKTDTIICFNLRTIFAFIVLIGVLVLFALYPIEMLVFLFVVIVVAVFLTEYYDTFLMWFDVVQSYMSPRSKPKVTPSSLTTVYSPYQETPLSKPDFGPYESFNPDGTRKPSPPQMFDFLDPRYKNINWKRVKELGKENPPMDWEDVIDLFKKEEKKKEREKLETAIEHHKPKKWERVPKKTEPKRKDSYRYSMYLPSSLPRNRWSTYGSMKSNEPSGGGGFNSWLKGKGVPV